MKQKYFLNNIDTLNILFNKPNLIYLKWDLWSWKTTISKYIINKLLKIKKEVTSPTYTYYNKYNLANGEYLFHFDLYKIQNYDEFFAIWWEDILDNNTWIILVEWPEIIEKYYKPDMLITLKGTEIEEEREIEIISFS